MGAQLELVDLALGTALSRRAATTLEVAILRTRGETGGDRGPCEGDRGGGGCAERPRPMRGRWLLGRRGHGRRRDDVLGGRRPWWRSRGHGGAHELRRDSADLAGRGVDLQRGPFVTR